MAYHDSTTGSGSSLTPAVAVPNAGGASPLQADDIVILVATIDTATADFATADWPTGFTELAEQALSGDGHTMAVGWKRLTGADTGSYTFGSVGGGTTPDWVCQAFAFRGRHATDPPVVSATALSNAANTTPVSVTATGVTAVAGDDLLMISAPDVRGSGAGNGHTQPTNYTEREDAENAWSNLAGFTRENVSAGATGNITATLALASDSAGWTAWLVRIPAVAGGAANDIAATGSLSVTGSANLDASGSLAAAGALSISGAADLDARGSLVAAGALGITGAADLDARGTLTAAGSLSIAGDADVEATGSLAATGSVAITGVASLSGSLNDLTASGSLAISGAADLEAIGSLTAAGALGISGAADLDAIGTLIAAGALSITGTADLDGASANSLAASGSVSITGAGSLTGMGQLIAAGTIRITGVASLAAEAPTDVRTRFAAKPEQRVFRARLSPDRFRAH